MIKTSWLMKEICKYYDMLSYITCKVLESLSDIKNGILTH